MSRPGSAPAIARGRPCRKCDADEWRKHRKGFACAACNRANNRKFKGDIARRLLYGAKNRAKQAGVPFTITVDDIRNVLPRGLKCPALGIIMVQGKGTMHDASPTLDRMNAAWGYTPDNICVISMAANRAKNNLRARDLEAIAAWMRSKGLD